MTAPLPSDPRARFVGPPMDQLDATDEPPGNSLRPVLDSPAPIEISRRHVLVGIMTLDAMVIAGTFLLVAIRAATVDQTLALINPFVQPLFFLTGITFAYWFGETRR